MDRHKFNITKAEFEDACRLLFETRSEELDNLSDSIIIMKYYVMALEDLFYNLTGSQLDLGQDIEPIDLEEVDF